LIDVRGVQAAADQVIATMLGETTWLIGYAIRVSLEARTHSVMRVFGS